MNLLTLIVLLILIVYTESYRILVCFPLPIKSVSSLGAATVNYLLNDGHEVTYITPYPIENTHKRNLRQIDIGNKNFFEGNEFNIDFLLKNKINRIDIKEFLEIMAEYTKLFFENENVNKLLENPTEHFDAVIGDLMECEVYSGLAVLYDCPMIWSYSMGAHWQVIRLIADSSNPAYDADYLGTNIPPFTFIQRVEELWARIKWSYYKTTTAIPLDKKIYEETFGPLLAKRGRTLPEYLDVVYNSSLIFGNEHNALMYKPSTPQNFKYIGGYHINDPVKPLAKDLQNIMDNAPNGVIYFSMGSLFKSKTWPKEMTTALLNIFSELKQTVIWKYEDNLPDLPRNVHIVNWAPQQSILAHPNCKFFITHGGLLSSLESVYFGVPTIGIPIWFDQVINVKKAQANGYALKVDFNNDLPQNLESAIKTMLRDDKYAKKAKQLSTIYHDRFIKPGAELTHWVGHVIRTSGAPHLRSPAINVPLYQRLYLDLLAVILTTCCIICILIVMLIKKININITKTKIQ